MRTAEIIPTICDLYEMRRPGMFWGQPGVGKSEMFEQATSKMGIGLVDLRVALMDPTDFKGFPMPDMKRGVMAFLRDELLPTKGEGILLCDEINSGSQLVQSVAMQLFLPPFRIGSYQLPKGWVAMGAGNRQTDRGVVNRMPTTVASRLVHVDVEPNCEDFITYVMDQLTAGNDIGSPELVAYLRFQEKNFNTFDPGSSNRTFACPRTWVAADAIRKRLVPMDKDGHFTPKALEQSHRAFELIRGAVGEGEGTDYWSFLKLAAELPSVPEIEKNPEKAPVPAGMAARIAISTTLATHVKAGAKFKTFMSYIERMDLEFQSVFIRDALRRDSSIRMDPTFTKWAVANEKVAT